jgi:hypothetical protein
MPAKPFMAKHVPDAQFREARRLCESVEIEWGNVRVPAGKSRGSHRQHDAGEVKKRCVAGRNTENADRRRHGPAFALGLNVDDACPPPSKAIVSRADAFLRLPGPRVLAIGGRSGTGKSTLARGIAPEIWRGARC